MRELIFVYNADSGLFNTLTDFAHKIASPSTYACHLCTLTYGNFKVKKEWNTFIQQLPLPTIFLHKNDFETKYHLTTDLPAVFIQKDSTVNVFISREEINSCITLQQLEDLISTKLTSYDQHHHTDL